MKSTNVKPKAWTTGPLTAKQYSTSIYTTQHHYFTQHTDNKRKENMALSLTNTFLQTQPILLPTKAKPSTRRNFSGQVTCRKKDIHPEFYEDAKVYCNGELVMTTGGTKKEYVVDVWSGNHPFYLGGRSKNLVDDDQVEKFRKKFGELSQIMEIPVLKGEIVVPSRRKSKGKKK